MSFLTDVVVFIHLGYASFVLVGFMLILAGAVLGWRWIRNRVFRWVHLGCIALVAVEAVVGQICPLTLLENWLLVRSGGVGYERTFIGQLLYDLLYYDFPAWVFTVAYVTLAALTALTLVLIPPVKRVVAGQAP
ncbi:MAG: DUF2784 domain-containing protein [Candidatus Neomarinimicrobiota bacterium]